MVQVRQAIKDDLEAWLDMRIQLWSSSTRKEHEKEVLDLSSDNNFIAFIVEFNGEPVGFLEAFIRPFANGCDSRPVPFLEGIWVSPTHRNKGLSKELLGKFEEWVKSKGFNEIGSDVEIENQPSISAHQSWGFEETERVVYFRKTLN